ncbi:MAG: aminotransferase [Gammaproteobacteria bacterium]|nr:aminotransferase [Gammaproteobacteria bacterium]
MNPSIKAGFSRFLADRSRLHFAAHSHHPWPDVSFTAHQQAWLDAAQLQDAKWGKVFSEIWPAAQHHVARLLRLPDPSSVCFAPNTHELVVRLASSIERRPLRVLTTDAEFWSFDRQLRRWEEAGAAVATRVAAEPFASFEARWQLAARRGGYDLVYLSQCFYDSGFVPGGLSALLAAVSDDRAIRLVDGYHGFIAFDTDLSSLAEGVCYLAGGYKYAMSGEGCCFAYVPPGVASRPLDTGWYAGFDTLSDTPSQIAYPADARRLLGATFDLAPLYRFNAVMDWLAANDLSPSLIHAHVGELQARFLGKLDALRLPLTRGALIPPAGCARGNFLCFRLPDAGAIRAALAAQRVTVDHRGDRLRIGFGVYHDAEDVDELLRRLARAPG